MSTFFRLFLQIFFDILETIETPNLMFIENKVYVNGYIIRTD